LTASVPAPAKLNLALVVGPRRPDGRHEVATVMQALDLSDRISLEPAVRLEVVGFEGDTIVRRALERIAAAGGIEPAWRARIAKQIPVAAGLAGGSSDAASALRLANETLPSPLDATALHQLGAGLGADVPFFLAPGPKLGTGDGTTLAALELPRGYVALLVLPHAETKRSTGDVYSAFDARAGEDGFAERRARLDDALGAVRTADDLRALPLNDLASSPLAAELLERGAFRADVSGAGPTVYGLFAERGRAELARRAVSTRGRTWLAGPSWYV
jgi:4-diphosphocytidyl-2-C-methyl-D-erythritol kinase